MSISTNVYSSSTAEVLMKRMKTSGYSDLKSAAFMITGGREEQVINQIGLELGINKTKEDKNLSFDRYVTSSNDAGNLLFQGNDGNLYGLDFTSNKTSKQSEDEWVEENYAGLINPEDTSDRNYDVVDFGQNSAEIINYAFTGVGDGADEIETNALDAFASNTNAEQWGSSIKWVYREVDLATPSKDFIENIDRNKSKYISSSEAKELYKLGGYNAYAERLFNNAVSAMNYNDESGELTASELVKYYQEKLAAAQAAEEAEKLAAAEAAAQAAEEAEKLAEEEAATQEAAQNTANNETQQA